MEFGSDHPALVGAIFALAVAMAAWWGDRRRWRRSDLDRVGLMPWQGLFVWALLAAVLLGAAALRG
ncbi:hypothetical protein ACFOON_15620 [Novosphingobium piscinae]|uniref:Uncharacterized protein n=1 Tax=Novosphingobium piscinae TaxID=1507448 RepID=A0A7X1FXE5_9SPHN|nr:hypothetical protein [Novosphingobium piscinae]MBC2668671.1 hypothetical protein [Novosphingobium piscinae]